MGGIGTGELLLIFVVVLLVFGAKRIPEIARSLGTAVSEFRSATREIQRQLDVSEPAPRVRPPTYSMDQTAPAHPTAPAETTSTAPIDPAAPAAAPSATSSTEPGA